MIDEAKLDQIVTEFKYKHGIHKIIAFSGGSNTELDGVPTNDPLQEQYKNFVKAFETRIIGDCLGRLRGYQIAILTGGTKWGVPKIAINKAKEYGLKTIGIYPLTGKKHALGNNLLDLSICIEPQFDDSRWGDESPIFTKLLDASVVISGGSGTLIECAHILKINEALNKSGFPLKFIIPISGTGGVADGLPFVWAKPEIRSICMPLYRVTNGFQAAEILRDKLDLDDYIE